MRSALHLTLGICGLGIGAAAAAEPPAPCTAVHGSIIEYSAVQRGTKTYLVASSMLPTSGWVVEFKVRPAEVTHPPQYTLLCKKPSGVVAQVLTRYTASVVLSGVQVGSTLVVYDGLGKHEVPVGAVMPPK